MRLGIISDIHGNLAALEAALGALQEEEAERIICLGDLVGYGPFPNEVIARVKASGMLCTLGAADERVAFSFARDHKPREGVADQTLEWTESVLEPESIEFLRSLPVQQRLDTPAGRLRAFHGSPDSPSTRLNLYDSPQKLMDMMSGWRAKLISCGATHIPYLRELGGGWFINPGSVGLSLNGEPGADYALLTIDEETGEASVHLGKAKYDVAAVAFDIIAWGLPELVAETVQRGKMPET